ncbi:general stress protein [Oceanobacillus jeddahense]|uniref:General stress protein n=1 Tax=Oceanobacillus jeddahense TaxID=1462527 RepID=A0ABY5K0N4_9BACI|nr:general stress protein [Oceanobacillus jeddahense]UUI04958.1 general stress protein [Oceanobacillus jeddahense]
MRSGVNKDLEKRLVYLFTGEFFAVVVFSFIYFNNFSLNQSYSLNYALFTLNFMLLQGSFYWFIKWRRLKSKRTVLPNLYKSLTILKKVNFTLICIMPLIVIIDIFIMKRMSFIFLVAVLVYIFAIIEYINYFHIQLTNYKIGKGKKSSIAKEIKNSKPKN